MARGAYEISQLIKACGGNEFSAYGLCHLGDYEATLFSQHSHNRMFGEMFVKNEPFSKLAEGVLTTKAVLKIASQHDLELPITEAINNILNKNVKPNQILKELFARKNKKEF